MKLLKSTFRSLNKFRLYTYVNILGLAISLACVIIIARHVHQETTVNHFAKDIERTFISSFEFQNNHPVFAEIGHYLNTLDYQNIIDDPAIDMVSRFIALEDSRITYNINKYIVNSLVVDTNFLNILPYPVLLGTAKFNHPNDVILNKVLAEKMFGNENPIGRVIAFTQGEPLQIIGVLGDPDTKTSFNFDIIINRDLKDNWGRSGNELIMLKDKSNIDNINQKYTDFTYIEAQNDQGRYQLYPLKDFYSNQTHRLYQYENPVYLRSESRNLKVLSLVAIFILLVGVFNFINIYQVVSMKRSREFEIHKIYGARSSHLFSYIYLQNLIMTVVALFFSWWFIEIIEALLNDQLGFGITQNIRFNIFLSATIIILLPLISSIYPYLRFSFTPSKTSLITRKSFLFFQYTITFGLLVISMFFVKQVKFMLDADLGYNTENLMMCTLMSAPVLGFEQTLRNNEQLIKQKMDQSTLFTEWTQGNPLYKSEVNYFLTLAGKKEYKQVAVDFKDHTYMDMFDFKLLEGRLWDSTDVFEQYKCIINETAMRTFNIENIHSEQLQFQSRLWITSRPGYDMDLNPPYQIVGVIEDFNTGHLSKPTQPVIFIYEEFLNPYSYLIGRFIPGKEKEAAAYLEELHREINFNADFKYSLMEDNIAQLYEKDKQVSNIYIIFALLSIFISCLGLFALSLFDIQQKYREVALRKINGATKKDIMNLMMKNYLLLISGSFLISIPLSYFAIYKYLQGFAYKADISWWLFVIAGIIVTGISLLTLMWQIRKAMKINPVKALNSEA